VTQPAGTAYVVRVWYVSGAGDWLFWGDSEPTFAIEEPQAVPLTVP
jgi:hypothetical protein